MIWLIALIVGLGLGLATGGKIGNLARIQFRWPWLVIAALVIREAAVATPLSHVEGVQYLYTVALAALVGWTIWQIGRVAGIWIVTAGASLNLVVIAANGGRMPVAPALAGPLLRQGHLGQYTLMTSGSNLRWLADWISMPGLIAQHVSEVYSPGDLVVAAGIAVVIFIAMRPVESRPRIVSDPP